MCTRIQLSNLTRDMVQEYRRVYGDNIEGIFLFGSYARGNQEYESDVDIVAIVHGERKRLQEQLKEIWDKSADIGLEKGNVEDVASAFAVFPIFQKRKSM